MDIDALGRVAGLRTDAQTAEQKSALERLTSGRGMIPAPYRFLIASPMVVDCIGGLGTAIRQHSDMDLREIEIVVLVTARHFGVEFVQRVHEKIALKAGLSPEAIGAILADDAEFEFPDARDQAIFRLAKSLHTQSDIGADLASQARAVLGDKTIAEIIGLIGVYTVTCYTMRFAAPSLAEADDAGYK